MEGTQSCNYLLINFLNGLFTYITAYIFVHPSLALSLTPLTSQDNVPASIVFTRLNSSVVTPPEAATKIPQFSPAVRNYDIKSDVGKKIVHFVDNWSHWSQLMKVRTYSLTNSLIY